MRGEIGASIMKKIKEGQIGYLQYTPKEKGTEVITRNTQEQILEGKTDR